MSVEMSCPFCNFDQMYICYYDIGMHIFVVVVVVHLQFVTNG